MPDKIRGNDAQDHTAQGGKADGQRETKTSVPPDKQDAANYDQRTDGGRAVEVENLSSADDEGAN